MFRLHRFYLDSAASEGNGEGGTAAPAPAPAPAPEPTASKAPDLGKAADGLIAKHGDPSAALRVLIAENYGYRDQLRDLKSKLPGDGAVVIKDDDAKAWEAYRKFGSPKDIKAALDEGSLAKSEAADYRRDAVMRQAADLHFPGKSGVLSTLAVGLEIEFQDGTDRAGKPTKQAVVKGEGDAVVPLTEYAKKNWADFLPSLQSDSARKPLGSPATGRATPPRPAIVPTEGTNAARRRNVL